MKVILDGSDSQRFDKVRDIRVLVAYQNAAFALRSEAMLERVGSAAGEGGRLIYTLWDFASLAVTPLIKIAAEDASNSDIVVFAAQEGEVLPKSVRDWIARWLLIKNGLPKVMVASLQPDPEHGRRPPVLLPYLAQVAEYGKMHFFAGTSEGLAQVDQNVIRLAHSGTTGTARKKVFTRPAPVTDTQAGMPNESERFSPKENSQERSETSMQEQGAGKE